MSRPIRWCFLAEPPRLTRGETPRLIPPQDEKSGALGLFCKWLEINPIWSDRYSEPLGSAWAAARLERLPAYMNLYDSI